MDFLFFCLGKIYFNKIKLHNTVATGSIKVEFVVSRNDVFRKIVQQKTTFLGVCTAYIFLSF